MRVESEAIRLLKEHQIPYHRGVDGISTLLRRSEVDVPRLRNLGFRISRVIGGQWVVSYKGSRFGLIL
jgi:hypothetical protein